MEITAAVLRRPDAPYSLETLQLAEPGPGQLIVRVRAVGHCHTDLLPRAGVLPIPMPVVAGHEGAGIVDTVGPGVTRVAPGDHVVISYASCGACPPCSDRRPFGCDLFGPLNLNGATLDGTVSATAIDGTSVATRWFGQSSFATHALVTERNVVRIDPDLPFELMAPLGCGLQTGAGTVLNTLQPRPGDSIAIYGTGAVGSAAIMAAAAAGCTTIVGVDLHEHRLDLARELGATHVVRGDTDDVAAAVTATTGRGVRFALDTTGVSAVAQAAVTALEVGGTLALVGVAAPDLAIPASLLSMGKTVVGVIEGEADPASFIPRLIELWRAGRFPIEKLVTTYPLTDIDRAEQAAAVGEVIKPVLLPG